MEPKARHSRDDLINMAREAEAAAEYSVALGYLRDLVSRGQPPTSPAEISLFSSSADALCWSLHEQWKKMATEVAEGDREGQRRVKLVTEELEEACKDVVSDVKSVYVVTKNPESKALLLALQGKCQRFLHELSPGDEEKKKQVEKIQKAAAIIAQKLPQTHPTRLELSLERCLFLRQSHPELAFETAKTAFDTAIAALDSLSDESYKDSTLVLQRLRDNMAVWGAEEREREQAREEARKAEEEKRRREEMKKRLPSFLYVCVNLCVYLRLPSFFLSDVPHRLVCYISHYYMENTCIACILAKIYTK